MGDYIPRSDADLENLAQDIVGGLVWSNYNGPDALDSFLVLHLMDQQAAEWMKANRIVFAYEYLSQASERSVNGRPSFFSVSYLNQADAERLHQRVQAIAKWQQDRLAAAAGSGQAADRRADNVDHREGEHEPEQGIAPAGIDDPKDDAHDHQGEGHDQNA